MLAVAPGGLVACSIDAPAWNPETATAARRGIASAVPAEQRLWTAFRSCSGQSLILSRLQRRACLLALRRETARRDGGHR